MNLIRQYASYAGAFELAFADDDWTRIEPFLADDIVVTCHSHPFVGGAQGLDAVVTYFRDSLDSFDRRFDDRLVTVIDQPRQDGQDVLAKWSATFCLVGFPDLRLDGTETARFRDDRIYRIDDYLSAEASMRTVDWLQRYECHLRPIVADFVQSVLDAAKHRWH